MKKQEGLFCLEKEILGFDFDGDEKTMVLSVKKTRVTVVYLAQVGEGI